MRTLTIFLLAILLSGCAFGHRTSYEGRSNFKINAEKEIIVAVHDMRPYVQNLNKSPDFTGIMKSLYGIPYNVTTKSGNPLADDFGLMIVKTMEFRNISASQTKIPFSWSFDTVKKEILGKENGALVYYIKMLEWKTETHFRPALHYNLQLQVFDDKGNEIESNQEKGFFYFDKNKPGEENLATSTSAILERLFSQKQASKLSNNDTSTQQKHDKYSQPQQLKKEEGSFGELPSNVKAQIKKKCSQEYPDNFVKQYNCAKEQAAAWIELNK